MTPLVMVQSESADVTKHRAQCFARGHAHTYAHAHTWVNTLDTISRGHGPLAVAVVVTKSLVGSGIGDFGYMLEGKYSGSGMERYIYRERERERLGDNKRSVTRDMIMMMTMMVLTKVVMVLNKCY